ncbi:PTS system mannose/fructose/sorbose family transporter subunit IID [Sporohalobacter salinus]|uniref:PTS system mannose/fructose/sorbose family transporter subunit IID n=1 Tax=Sporohalobacter salinus TaxID=1494606 RepID=UPI00195F2BEF|nr:PTS system mannose/fructose/sorbose family transporter subunit IID [Sporohalobacter salinus]MBM7624911.1 mannose/fructose/sorbose-specific phosphotransferase system IID component [Sporohalobacter salinus]
MENEGIIDSNEFDGKITRKDLRKVFWRSLTMQASWNFAKQMSLAYCFCILPILKKVYETDEEVQSAVKRHFEFFNATPAMTTFILGISAAMEEQNSENEDFNEKSINSIKVALMGPLSGIGDSFFWGTFKVIAAGLGIQFAKQGSILGPIVALVTYNIPHFVTQYYGTFIGYKAGTKYLKKILNEGLMDRITYIASIVGLMVVGSMVANMIDITTPLVINTGESSINVQAEVFDKILPSALPLISTVAMYKFIKKGYKTNYILLGTITFGVIAGAIGLLQ